jgi:hypothetical protein
VADVFGWFQIFEKEFMALCSSQRKDGFRRLGFPEHVSETPTVSGHEIKACPERSRMVPKRTA